MKRRRSQRGYQAEQSGAGDLPALLAMYQQFSPAQQTQDELAAAQLAALQYANEMRPEQDALQLDSMRSEIEARKAAVAHQAAQDQLLQAQMGKASAQEDQIKARMLMETVGAAGDNPVLQKMLLEQSDPEISSLAAKAYPLASLGTADQQQMKMMGEGPSEKPIERGRFLSQMISKNPNVKNTFTRDQMDSLDLFNDYMTLPSWIDQTPELQRAQAVRNPEELMQLRRKLATLYDPQGTPLIPTGLMPFLPSYLK